MAASGLAVAIYAARRLKGTTGRDRYLLGTLRAAALLLVVGCLLRPAIIVTRAVPQRNILAILLDDSRSMRIADVEGGRRIDASSAAFADSARLVRQLGERFALRFFRFSSDAVPLGTTAELTATGTRTDLAAGLDAVRQELADVPLAGVVVVSDGADNTSNDLEPPLLGFRARRVPLYTVGVGEERFARDIAVERIVLPSSVLVGGAVVADVTLGVRGYDRTDVELSVEANGRVIHQERVPLRGGRETVSVPVRVPPLPEGTHLLRVRAKPLDGETITENNEAQGVLRVRAGREKVLYLEGEPRPEFGFLRRAVAEDSALQLVALLRSATGKYLRLGVADSLDLASGFPTRRADLFRYRAIVLGSIEAAYFSGDQLRMLAEFVSRRGGSLLALGGRSSFAEGGFTGTPLDEVLPLSLSGGSNTSADPFVELALRPTPAGLGRASLQLGDTRAASETRWGTLPRLSSVNQLGGVRPGATVLLSGEPAGGGPARPVLVAQRYGRGSSMIFAVQDSWLWQMDPATPIDDLTHATFWRQMLRGLLDDVPDRVMLEMTPERVAPGESVTLRARVADAEYLDVNDAGTSVRVTPPIGEPFDVHLDRVAREDGSYTGRFTATDAGRYDLVASAIRADEATTGTAMTMLVDTLGVDMERAELRSPLLRRIADETGGQYYPLADAGRLVEDVQLTESGITVRDAHDLWDAPIVFFALLGLLGAEWWIRRRRGLS